MNKILIVLLCLGLCGCSANTRNVKGDFALDKTSGNSLVFGKVSLENFKYWNRGFNLYARNLNTGGQFRIVDDKRMNIFASAVAKEKVQDYYFFVNLPSGEYKVFGIYIIGAGGYIQIPVNFDLSFLVEPNSIVYIGTLKLSALSRPNVFTGRIDYQRDILDEGKETSAELRKRYPQITDEVVGKLMKMTEGKAR